MRPLVLLDVDGVINDLRRGIARPWKTDYYDALGYTISVPEYMPDLLQRVHRNADIVWCTTWEERANDYISPLVGLPDDLPYVRLTWDPYAITNAKSLNAYRAAAPYLWAGASVYWVEDFDIMPDEEIVTAINTVPEYVLTPKLGELLP